MAATALERPMSEDVNIIQDDEANNTYRRSRRQRGQIDENEYGGIRVANVIIF